MEKYKQLSFGKFKFITPILGLFIPLPIFSQQPDFVIKGYGFGSSISISKIPLGLIMIIIAIIF
jgi:hypothetical protein